VNCAAVTANFTADVIHYAISGTITFNGVGLAGVNMTLSGGPANDTTTTDASGNYSFTGLANGSYTVTPTPCQAGYNFNPASRSAPVNGADVPGVNFTAIYATYAISGRVTSGGVGLAGVNMTLSGAKNATTTTDESGNYSFPGLANGSYTVTPSPSEYYTFTPASRPVTVNCAAVTSNFTASPITYYLISGTVTSYGYPSSGVTMTLSGAMSDTTTTDTSGYYSFTVLNGIYTVTPALAGYNFTPASASVPVNGANVPAVNFTGLGT
jgi:inhibitor of cysteine peptidase